MDRFALLKKDSYDAALLREQKKLQYQDEVDRIAVEGKVAIFSRLAASRRLYWIMVQPGARGLSGSIPAADFVIKWRLWAKDSGLSG